MKSILVVEDTKSIQALIETTLVNAGYEVVTCDDGVAANTALKKQKIDLIITDMHMPKMDGLRLVQMLHNKKSDTPILVSTSDQSDKTREDFKGKGVKGWLSKPIDSTRLLTAVNTLLDTH
jgi:two-component system chemotaxis response regulator CheY